jgi:hypothetical protein
VDGVAQSLVWIILFTLVAIGMLIFVPRREILKLLPFGVVGGFLLAAIIQIVAVWVLGLWSFNYTQIASYRGIPIFLTLVWLPTVIIFGHWLLQIRSGTGRFFFTAAFALATVALEWAFVFTGYRQYHRFWNVFYTALLALVLHYLLAWYLLSVRRPMSDEHKVVPLQD